jgi:hypothetical protein
MLLGMQGGCGGKPEKFPSYLAVLTATERMRGAGGTFSGATSAIWPPMAGVRGTVTQQTRGGVLRAPASRSAVCAMLSPSEAQPVNWLLSYQIGLFAFRTCEIGWFFGWKSHNLLISEIEKVSLVYSLIYKVRSE